MSSAQLFGSFALGMAITLHDIGARQDFTGLIQGIDLESGYEQGEQPQHFLVKLRVRSGIATKDHTIYVRTS